MSDTFDWLSRLYARSPGYFVVTPFKDGRPLKSTWFSTSEKDIARAATAIEKAGTQADVYVSVATHKEIPDRGRGSIRTVTSIPGFWADLDIGEEGHKPAALPNPTSEEDALAIIDGLPEPSAVVHTGGGIQVWWMFDEPWVFDDPSAASEASAGWQEVLRQRGESLGLHVDVVGDLPRILRAPGSENHKTGVPRPVEIRRVDGPVHQLDLLTSLAPPIDSDVDGGDRGTTDTFPLSWDRILEPHGYTLAGKDSSTGADLWSRPGKNPREGHSLTTGAHGIPVAVNFSASDPYLPSGPGQRLTKLRVYALLNHQGNIKEARKALSVLLGPSRLGPKYSRSSLAHIPPPQPMIEGVINTPVSAIMFGPSSVGKTFTALSMAAAIATGHAWLGRYNVAVSAPVIYAVGEGGNGIGERLTAWEAVHNEGKMIPDDRFRPIIKPQTLTDPLLWEELTREAIDFNAKFVVLDTFSSLAPDADETKDAAVIVRRMSDLAAAIDGTVLLLHHSGWNNAERVRGGSQLEANTDETIRLSRIDIEDVGFVMTRKKVKDGADGARIFLTRRSVPETNSQVVELGDSPGAIKADRKMDETSHIIAFLCSHSLLTVGQNKAADEAIELGVGVGRDRIRDAIKMWKAMSDIEKYETAEACA